MVVMSHDDHDDHASHDDQDDCHDHHDHCDHHVIMIIMVIMVIIVIIMVTMIIMIMAPAFPALAILVWVLVWVPVLPGHPRLTPTGARVRAVPNALLDNPRVVHIALIPFRPLLLVPCLLFPCPRLPWSGLLFFRQLIFPATLKGREDLPVFCG